ncbi:MAG: HEAT repeat domain-containing protein [Pirellulales bacterium]
MQLTTRDNAAMTGLLNDVRESTFVPLLQVLHGSQRAGVLRLLIGFLDDARPPSAGLASLFRRTDRRCVDALLRKFHSEPGQTLKNNLRHVEHIAWLHDQGLIDQLEDSQQQAVVRLATSANLKRDDVVKSLEHIALRGKPGGRRAAIEGLRPFNGADANAVVLRALRDGDVYVRAAALSQLRPRGIPGALTSLIDALDSSSRPERDAARANLEEFNFKRFLPAFDMLEEEVRRTTAALVKKIDYSAAQQLREEMESPQAKRRTRALRITAAMELAKELEPELIARADDDDHLVRVEATRVLATLTTAAAQEKLLAMASDSSFAVREAAWAALEEASRIGGGLSLEELERLRESFSEATDAAHRAERDTASPIPPLDFPLPPSSPTEAGYGG